jgi:ferredoxin--NADP+ reductase
MPYENAVQECAGEGIAGQPDGQHVTGDTPLFKGTHAAMSDDANQPGGAAHPAQEKASRETITSVRRWTDNLFTFRSTRPEGYRFTPGQYARLGLPYGDGMIWRAYSLTSDPAQEELEYYGILVPGGAFTTQLKDIEAGAPIWIERQSFGFMTADRFSDGETLWMLSTGTGIGPYLSILRDAAVWSQFRELVLVHCVRHASELTYEKEIRQLQTAPPTAARNPGRLQLIQCTTRESVDGVDDAGDANGAAAAGRLHGRITTLIESGELERKAGLPLAPETARVMLCGNPAMIEQTRRILHERGMKPCRRATPGQFVTENYW